jgi:hypothetical protein
MQLSFKIFWDILSAKERPFLVNGNIAIFLTELTASLAALFFPEGVRKTLII